MARSWEEPLQLDLLIAAGRRLAAWLPKIRPAD